MKKEIIRKVLAQYLGNNEETLDIPWMDYMKRRTKDKVTPSNQNSPDFYKNKGKREETFDMPITPPGAQRDIGPSLINDVIDPMSLNKEQDVTPSNENDSYRSDGDSMSYPIGINKFERDTNESLKWWWRARNRQDLNTGNPWGSNLNGLESHASLKESTIKKASMGKVSYKNIHQILESSNHDKTQEFKERGKRLRPKKISSGVEEGRGLFEFVVSDESDDSTSTVKIQFLKTEDKTENLLDHPCQMGCSCNSFLYWGPQYYAVKGNYMYMPMFRPQIIPPSSKDDGGRGKGLTFCKHIYAVTTHLTEMGVDKDYGEDIKKQLLSIEDTLVPKDVEESIEKYHVDRKTNFKQLLEDPSVHGPILEEALRLLKKNEMDEHHIADYITGEFSKESDRTQELIIEEFSDSPDIVILLLLEYKKAFGSIPVRLVDTAYENIKDHIS